MNTERRADLAVAQRRQVLAAEYALERAVAEHGAESVRAVGLVEYLASLRSELARIEDWNPAVARTREG